MNAFLKNHYVALLALALMLAFVTPALADEASGTIAVIDPDDHTFTLVDENNNVLEMNFLVSGSLLIDDQEATIWDLQPGDFVRVTYDLRDDRLTATEIECRRTR